MPDIQLLERLHKAFQKASHNGTKVDGRLPWFYLMCEFLEENASLPDKTESVAVTFAKPKTAALCYDRVWDPTGQVVPESIRCSGSSPAECNILSFFCLFPAIPPVDWGTIFKRLYDGVSQGTYRGMIEESSGLLYPIARVLAQGFSDSTNHPATPIYGSAQQQQEEYQPGDHQAIVAALENLNIVDESQLTWDQIMQFREDTESRSKYRRLMHWMDKDMVGKPQSFVEDEIAIKLENYEHALEKHGIKSVVGAFKDLLYDNLGLFGAAGLAAAGFPYLAGGIVVGKVGVKLAEARLDLDDVKRGDNSEIAAIYEIKQLDAGPDA